jgi:hypothetical protein
LDGDGEGLAVCPYLCRDVQLKVRAVTAVSAIHSALSPGEGRRT